MLVLIYHCEYIFLYSNNEYIFQPYLDENSKEVGRASKTLIMNQIKKPRAMCKLNRRVGYSLMTIFIVNCVGYGEGMTYFLFEHPPENIGHGIQ